MPYSPRFRLAAILAAILLPAPLAAHEFWIDPVSHSVKPGGEIVASLRIGQRYEGDAYPYLSSRFERFTVTDADGTRDYEGDQGDQPALETEADAPGLTVVTYVSRPSTLTYRQWEKFVSFTENEGLTGAVARHRADALPETGFRESYRRHAKAFVQVGPVDPAERETAQGLDFELLALANPFDPALDALPVRLLRFGEPAADVQISVFRKGNEGEVTVETLRTDAEGEARIALEDGARYLLNAVVMDRVTDRPRLLWASEWASLTFARP